MCVGVWQYRRLNMNLLGNWTLGYAHICTHTHAHTGLLCIYIYRKYKGRHVDRHSCVIIDLWDPAPKHWHKFLNEIYFIVAKITSAALLLLSMTNWQSVNTSLNWEHIESFRCLACNKSINHSINQSIIQLIIQLIIQSIITLIIQSTKQSIIQSITQSITQ